MTADRVLPFPTGLGPCPQCGWRHPDPKIKLLRWCPECEAEPLYPWTCPNCETRGEVTAQALLRWSVGLSHPPSSGVKVSFGQSCPACNPGLSADST